MIGSNISNNQRWVSDKKHFYTRLLLMAIFVFILFLLASCSSSSDSSDDDANSKAKENASIHGNVNLGNIAGNRASVTGVSITARKVDESFDNGADIVNSAKYESEAIYTTVTDSTGAYLLKLGSGKYIVEAQGGATSKAIAQVEVKAGEAKALDITLSATGSIVGRVPTYFEGDIVFIPGTSYVSIPDGFGYFSISNIPVGSYLLQIGGDRENSFGVTVTEGTNDIGMINTETYAPTVWRMSMEESWITPDQFSANGIYIEFTKIMEPISTEAAITIQPEINNLTFDWSDDYRRLHISAEGVSIGNYELNIATTALSRKGSVFKPAYKREFSVEERITFHVPNNGFSQSFVNGSVDPVKIYFSTNMDENSLAYSISPTPDNLVADWEGNVLHLRADFEIDTKYAVEISKATTINGSLIENLPYNFEFTNTLPKLVSSLPTQGAIDVSPEQPVRLNFNGRMDRDSVESGLTITDVEGNEIAGDDYNLIWESDCFFYSCGYKGVDSLLVSFNKEYNSSYAVTINNASTLSGLQIEAFSLNYNTAKEKLMLTHPSQSEFYENGENIELFFNFDLDLSEAEFVLKDVVDTSYPLLVRSSNEIGYLISSRKIFLNSEQYLPAGKDFVLSWSGIKSTSGSNISDGELSFSTHPRRILDVSPTVGATHVPLSHRVKISFNDQINETDQATIVSALNIDAAKAIDDITHPKSQFIWSQRENGDSQLIINFTFDEGTNYKIWLNTDEFGNVVNELGDTVLNDAKPSMFSTISRDVGQQLPAKELLEKVTVSNFLNFQPENYLSPQGVRLNIEFDTYVNLQKADIEIKDESGESIELGFLNDLGQTLNWSDRRYSTEWRVNLPELEHNSTYTVTIKDVNWLKKQEYCSAPNTPYQCNDSYYQQFWKDDVIYNLPFDMSFSTSGPKIYLDVNNISGTVEFEAAQSVYFSTAELKNAFSSVPAIRGVWDFDANEESPEYVSRARLNYPPVQYANMQIKLDELQAYKPDDSNLDIGVTHELIGRFHNTPFSEVFDISPNVTAPVLLNAKAIKADEILLAFNVYMDAELIKDTTNYHVSDSAGNTLQITSAVAFDDDNPNFTKSVLLTTEKQVISENYSITVQNLTEWGGSYVIADPVNTKEFAAYSGVIVSATKIFQPISTQTSSDIYLANVLVKFDVPISIDSVTSDNLTVECDYCGEINLNSMVWNADNSAVQLHASQQGGFYFGDVKLVVGNGIKNIAGVDISANDFAGRNSVRNESPLPGFYDGNGDPYAEVDPHLIFRISSSVTEQLSSEQVVNTANYHVSLRDASETVMPEIINITQSGFENSYVTLYFSEALPVFGSSVNQYYTIALTGVHFPGSDWEGTGLYPTYYINMTEFY